MKVSEIRTAQDVVDYVLPHLAAQGWEPSRQDIEDSDINNNGCAYRGRNGAKCAVGFFIPDALYDPAFESENANTLCIYVKEGELFNFLQTFKDVLYALQNWHDNDMISEDVESSLHNLAADLMAQGLKVKIVMEEGHYENIAPMELEWEADLVTEG